VNSNVLSYKAHRREAYTEEKEAVVKSIVIKGKVVEHVQGV